MKFQILSVAALASLASAVSDALNKRDSPLDVSLEVTDNTNVKATIKNTGTEDLKLFKTGTFLDDSHVEKVEVFRSGKQPEQVAFDGLRLRVSTANLDESAFKILKAGETIEAAFDIAVAHDMSAGGDFDLLTEGAFAYAELDGTSIAGAVPFISNNVTTAVAVQRLARFAATELSLLSARLYSRTVLVTVVLPQGQRCPTAPRLHALPPTLW